MRIDFQDKQDGFTLIIVPIFFVIMALFLISVLDFTKPKAYYFETSTGTKMEQVQTALSAYAHRNYRIPCPADPSIDPVANPGAFGFEQLNCNAANSEGIVPFRTLGLTEQDVKDEWGNFLTYAVSPSFTGFTTATDFNRLDANAFANGQPANLDDIMLVSNAADQQTYVHEACRDSAGWQDRGVSTYTGPDGVDFQLDSVAACGTDDFTFSKNIYKAQFCCGANLIALGVDRFSLETDYFENVPASSIVGESDHNEASGSYTFLSDTEVRWTINGIPAATIEAGNGQSLAYFEDSTSDANQGLGVFTPANTDGVPVGKALGTDSFNINFDNPSASVNFVIGDISANDANQTFQVSVTFVDADGNALGTFPLVFQTVSGPNGLMTISISADSIIDEQTGENLILRDNPNVNFEDIRISDVELLGPNTQIDGPSDYTWTLSAIERVQAGSTVAPGDLRIVDENSALRVGATRNAIAYRPAEDTALSGGQNINYANYNTTEAIFEDNKTQNFIASGWDIPAYVLISHGPNKSGAYLVNGTANKHPMAGAGVLEQENADGNVTYNYMRRINTTDANNYYDDIVLWDTQFSLYNALANGTCQQAQALFTGGPPFHGMGGHDDNEFDDDEGNDDGNGDLGAGGGIGGRGDVPHIH